jgi:signal transduction histidine kinase
MSRRETSALPSRLQGDGAGEPDDALEAVQVRLGADGRILAVVVDGGGKLRHLRGLRQGARLDRTLQRFDGALARELDKALAERLPLAGVATMRTRGGPLTLDYRFEPEGEASTGELTLLVRAARAVQDPPSSQLGEQGVTHVLAEVASLLNREMSADDVARSILPLVVRGAGATTGALFRVRGDGRADVLSAFGPTRRRGFPYRPLDLADPRLAAVSRKPGLMRIGATEGEGTPSALADLCPRGWTSLVVAPAFAGNVVQGLLIVAGGKRTALDAHQTSLLRIVADMTGLFLGLAAISSHSESGERVLDAAGAVARAVSGSLDLERTFAQIASSAARIMGNCSCLLLEQGPDSEELVVVAASDPEDACLSGATLVFEGADQTRAMLQLNRSIVVEDLNWGVHTPAAARKRLRFRSVLFVPIHAQEGLIGSLLLYSAERREKYSERDVARAQMVAEQAASAISNARLFRTLTESQLRAQALLERITRLRQEQRRALADIIHDDIVQTVAAALYETEALRDRLPSEALIDADRVASLLRTTIAEARGVIRDLRPPTPAGLDLHDALRALADRLAGEMAWQITLSLEDAPGIGQEVESSLYAVAREALNNVKWHARASRVAVSLGSSEAAGRRGVCLEIRDNGLGFDTAAGNRLDHFGLMIMDEHAALVGGVVNVDSRPGGGTRVRVLVPLNDGGTAVDRVEED